MRGGKFRCRSSRDSRLENAKSPQTVILLLFDEIYTKFLGVGQAEHAVLNMVDCMILLIPPGSGDELQGLKKGVAELADIIAITKYDGSLMQDAIRVKTEYMSAMKFIRKKSKFWTPRVSFLDRL